MRRILDLLVTTALTTADSAARVQDRPNIVIFHCHDLGQYLHGDDPLLRGAVTPPQHETTL